jgi:hypothetical protein
MPHSQLKLGQHIMALVRDASNEIRITRKMWSGVEWLDIRVWWNSPTGWVPTKQGVQIPIHQTTQFLQECVQVLSDKLLSVAR